MNTVIIGGGKVGYNLARILMEKGAQVRIVEKDKSRSIALADELDIPVVCSGGMLAGTMRDLELEKCDVLIAVTGCDEVNMVACEIALRHYNVKKTVARVNNPKNIDIMKRLGIKIAVSSSGLIAKLIEQEVDDTAIRLISNLNRGEASINEYKIPEKWSKSGSMIMDLQMPVTCVIVSVTRNGQLYIPRGTTVLYGGDELIIFVTGNAGKELKKLFEL